MDYKLAKQLKEAGFPQPEITDKSFDRNVDENKFLLRENADSRSGPYMEGNDRTMWVQYYEPEYVEEMKEFVVYIPTLSELIEACNPQKADEFYLNTENGKWRAFYRYYGFFEHNDKFKKEDGIYEVDIEVFADTPEEAISLLWIKLKILK